MITLIAAPLTDEVTLADILYGHVLAIETVEVIPYEINCDSVFSMLIETVEVTETTMFFKKDFEVNRDAEFEEFTERNLEIAFVNETELETVLEINFPIEREIDVVFEAVTVICFPTLIFILSAEDPKVTDFVNVLGNCFVKEIVEVTE